MQEEDKSGSDTEHFSVIELGAAAPKPALGEDRTVQDVLESLGGVADDDVTLKVWRRDRRTGAKEWCADYTLSDLPLEAVIAEQHGGGHYVVQVWTPNPGRRGASPKGSATIRISESVRPAVKSQPEAPQPATPQLDVATLAEKLVSGITAALKPALERVAAPAPASGMTLQQALQLAPTVIPLLQKLFGGSGGSQKSLVDQLTEVATLKDKLGALFGESGGDDMLDKLGKIFEGMKELAKQRPMPGAPAPGAVASPDTGNTQEVVMLQNLIRDQLGQLCVMAGVGANAAQAAQMAMEHIPESYDDQLVDMLGETDAEAVDNLVAICPDVAAHRAWFMSFCATMRSAYEPEGDGGDLTNNEPGRISAGEGSTTN